jgi:hypothetical protein
MPPFIHLWECNMHLLYEIFSRQCLFTQNKILRLSCICSLQVLYEMCMGAQSVVYAHSETTIL